MKPLPSPTSFWKVIPQVVTKPMEKLNSPSAGHQHDFRSALTLLKLQTCLCKMVSLGLALALTELGALMT